MSREDQLEIIGPGGQIEFHTLDAGKGITNIGRHAGNDIVIDSPGVAPFCAVLDHQARPYRIMALTDDPPLRMEGQPMAPNVFHELRDWDTVELNGYSIVLLEAEGALTPATEFAPRSAPAAPLPLPAQPLPPPEVRMVGLPILQPDQVDDVVVAELSAREWSVDVDQTASCQLTVVNGGHLVATFAIQVEGLDESWVQISAPQVNLYEGGRTTVTITMTPPRLPSSSAGPHHLAVIVTSYNYPGRSTCLGATLYVNPYYEFTVGELAPKQQTVSWRKRVGEAAVPITNKGNSQGVFRLEGDDDERGCRFEFQVPGEQARLAKQAELHLAADETYLLPIFVTPIRRRVVALRSRQYHYTVTTTMIEGGQLPRSVMGSLRARSLIGPLHVLLGIFCLATLILFLFKPGASPVLLVSTTSPEHGQEVALNYNASRFLGSQPSAFFNNLNSLWLKLTIEYRPAGGGWVEVKSPVELQTPAGRTEDTPLVNGSYRLRASNWLSQIIPVLEGKSKEIPMYVTPIQPRITFEADRLSIMEGESVLLYWRAMYAETLLLEHDGIQETLADVELIDGRRTMNPLQDTTYILIADNSSWEGDVRVPLTVRVVRPTATPIPTPVIVRFDVDPLVIMVGEKVKIDWEVQGADLVSIENLGQGLPLKGAINDQPPESIYYQLTALKSGDDGSQVKNTSLLQEVIVNPLPTATAVPQPPVIEVFEATPKEVIAAQGQAITLTWSVVGTVTDVEISSPTFLVAGLDSQDTVSVTVNDTTLFVITAFNGDLKASKAVEIKAIPPTPTPSATPIPTPVPPTATPTPTPTPYPPPVLTFYKADPFDPETDKVVFATMFEGENGPVFVYNVEVGSRVKLSWQVKNADTVILQNLGTQPSEGSVVLPDPIIASGTYVLSAENNKGANQIKAFLQMEVTAPQPPPPPFNVRGTEDAAGGKNTVAWSYKDEDRLDIDGFRIYRTLVPPGGEFAPVWTEYSPAASSWTDEVGRTCGKAYYVVAVYTDPVTGSERESEVSPTSWFTSPCP